MPTKPERATLPRVMPFKKAAAESGFAYSSLRDAHFRGELAIVRVGRAWSSKSRSWRGSSSTTRNGS
jgi:hypothetical protein